MNRKLSGFLLSPLLAAALCAPVLAAPQPIAPESPAAAQPAAPAAIGDAPVAARPDESMVKPPQNELSPGAQETYAYLLFIQAILDEDEAALLDAAGLLAKTGAPASIWLDGGVWLMSKKSPNSVVYLEKAREALPDDLSLALLLAEALGDHGMADRGVQMMRDYLGKHEDAMDARLELALLLVKNREFGEAQKILGGITPKQRTPLVDYYQAKALIGMDRRAEAIPYLRKAIKGMPDFVEALAELAFIYEREGNLREARSLYERLQKMQFAPQDVALRLINLSLKLKQPEKALEYIRKGPDSLPFRLASANMLMESRHYLQAESILKKIAKEKDAPPEVFLLLADLTYEQRRDLNAAFTWLAKIPQNGPAAPRAALMRLQLLADAGKNAQALKEVSEFMARFPEAPEFRDFEIRMLARDKKMSEALAAARAATAKWPDNMDFSFLLGSLLDESGEKKEAMSIMEKILEKQPDNYQALNYVGFTLADENREIPRALELLKKADELAPNQAYIVDSLAWALYRSGQVDEALRQIRRAVSLDGNIDAAIWEHYGDIAASKRRKDEARKAYRRAIEMKPANVDKIRAKISRL